MRGKSLSLSAIGTIAVLAVVLPMAWASANLVGSTAGAATTQAETRSATNVAEGHERSGDKAQDVGASLLRRFKSRAPRRPSRKFARPLIPPGKTVRAAIRLRPCANERWPGCNQVNFTSDCSMMGCENLAAVSGELPVILTFGEGYPYKIALNLPASAPFSIARMALFDSFQVTMPVADGGCADVLGDGSYFATQVHNAAGAAAYQSPIDDFFLSLVFTNTALSERSSLVLDPVARTATGRFRFESEVSSVIRVRDPSSPLHCMNLVTGARHWTVDLRAGGEFKFEPHRLADGSMSLGSLKVFGSDFWEPKHGNRICLSVQSPIDIDMRSIGFADYRGLTSPRPPCVVDAGVNLPGGPYKADDDLDMGISYSWYFGVVADIVVLGP